MHASELVRCSHVLAGAMSARFGLWRGTAVTSPVVTAYADDAADLPGNLAPLALVGPGLFRFPVSRGHVVPAHDRVEVVLLGADEGLSG